MMELNVNFTEKQIELQNLLLVRKAETEAWVAEDPQNRFAGWLTTDLSHWIEMGVNSVEDLERYELISFISDTSKDVYGFRSRLNFDAMTVDELKEEADSLAKAGRAEFEYEEKAREDSILAAMDAGAPDRETAIRWMEENV
jgi:hypothetical protein